MTTFSNPEPTLHRLREIDLVKAVSIVAVVLIHSIGSPWDPSTHPVELWLGHAASFAVPAFVAASGFLWAADRERDLRRSTLRRLRRLLVPYLVVSLAVQALRAATGVSTTAAEILHDLLLASTYDIYYYVFVAVLFALAMPLFCRIPRRRWPEATILLIGASLIARGLGWGDDAFALPLDIYLRNPFLFAGYFAVGWLSRLHYPELGSRADADRGPLLWLAVGAVVVCLAVVALPFRTQCRFVAHWEYHYAAMALLFLVARSTSGGVGVIRFLSDSTYGIFLIHPVCIAATNRILTLSETTHWVPVDTARFVIGLLGSIAIVSSVRLLAPRYSRDLVGA